VWKWEVQQFAASDNVITPRLSPDRKLKGSLVYLRVAVTQPQAREAPPVGANLSELRLAAAKLASSLMPTQKLTHYRNNFVVVACAGIAPRIRERKRSPDRP